MTGTNKQTDHFYLEIKINSGILVQKGFETQQHGIGLT
jgi:hypothetical protein